MFGLSKSDVEKMESKGDVEGLIKALAYEKDEFIWSSTGEALGKHKDHALVRQLDRLRTVALSLNLKSDGYVPKKI